MSCSRNGCWGCDDLLNNCFLLFIELYFSCIAPIAQLVEQVPFKDKVAGSIPAGRTFV